MGSKRSKQPVSSKGEIEVGKALQLAVILGGFCHVLIDDDAEREKVKQFLKLAKQTFYIPGALMLSDKDYLSNCMSFCIKGIDVRRLIVLGRIKNNCDCASCKELSKKLKAVKLH